MEKVKVKVRKCLTKQIWLFNTTKVISRKILILSYDSQTGRDEEQNLTDNKNNYQKIIKIRMKGVKIMYYQLSIFESIIQKAHILAPLR